MSTIFKELQSLKQKLKSETKDSSWERTWKPEDEKELGGIFKVDQELFERLTPDIKAKFEDFMN